MKRTASFLLPLVLAACPKDPDPAPEAGSSGTTGELQTMGTDTGSAEPAGP